MGCVHSGSVATSPPPPPSAPVPAEQQGPTTHTTQTSERETTTPAASFEQQDVKSAATDGLPLKAASALTASDCGNKAVPVLLAANPSVSASEGSESEDEDLCVHDPDHHAASSPLNQPPPLVTVSSSPATSSTLVSPIQNVGSTSLTTSSIRTQQNTHHQSHSFSHHHPHHSPHPSVSVHPVPLSLFPSTDEAKIKIDRQLKRHTSTSTTRGATASSSLSTPENAVLRPSISQAVHTTTKSTTSAPVQYVAPPSPSRSQRFALQHQHGQDPDMGEALSRRHTRTSTVTTSSSPKSVSVSSMDPVTHLLLQRTLSKQKMIDIDNLPAESVSALNSPIGRMSSIDPGGPDSDSDKDSDQLSTHKGDLRKPSRSLRQHTDDASHLGGSLSVATTHSHNSSTGLFPPRSDRRQNNRSAEFLSSDEDGSGGASPGAMDRMRATSTGILDDKRVVTRNATTRLAGRDRIHLRSTSRDKQNYEEVNHTVQRDKELQLFTEGINTAPGTTNNPTTSTQQQQQQQLSHVPSRKSSRRFTKTRHSNAFDTELLKAKLLHESHSSFKAETGTELTTTTSSPVGVSAPTASIPSSSDNDSDKETAHKKQPSTGALTAAAGPADSTSSSGSDRSLSPIRPAAPQHPHQHFHHHQCTASRSHLLPFQPLTENAEYTDTVNLSPLQPPSSHRSSSSTPRTPSYGALSPLSTSRASVSRNPSRGKKLALLVDPLLVSQRINSVALHKHGFTVITASKVNESIDLACAHRFELILCDWDTSAEDEGTAARAADGAQIVSGIRSVEEERGDEPTVILALNASLDPASLLMYDQAGCDGCIEKGVGLMLVLNDLMTCVQDAHADSFLIVNQALEMRQRSRVAVEMAGQHRQQQPRPAPQKINQAIPVNVLNV